MARAQVLIELREPFKALARHEFGDELADDRAEGPVAERLAEQIRAKVFL